MSTTLTEGSITSHYLSVGCDSFPSKEYSMEKEGSGESNFTWKKPDKHQIKPGNQG